MKANRTFGKMVRQINEDRLQALLIDAVNAYSPTYAEAQAIDVFVEALECQKIPFLLQPVPMNVDDDSRANVVIRLGPEPLALMLVGHLDTIELWHDERHGAHVEGDILYGLGAADMKGGCAAIIEALSAVVESGVSLRKGLCVALVVGEEEDGDGAEALVAAVRSPLTVLGEPTNLAPCITHYGYLETLLRCTGLRAHAALPHAGANAIHAMLAWMMSIIDAGQTLPFAEGLAMNPREIHGGEPYFVVAEQCEAMMDFHMPPKVGYETVEEVIKEAREAVARLHNDVTMDYKKLFWAPGYENDPHDERLEPLHSAYRRILLPWNPTEFRSHSDANIFQRNGSVVVLCGPGDLAVAHGRNEHIVLAEVERAARLYTAMIHEACVADDERDLFKMATSSDKGKAAINGKAKP